MNPIGVVEQKSYFNKALTFFKQEQSIFNSIYKDMVNLSNHFNQLQELFISDAAVNFIDNNELAEMVTRAGFLYGEIEICRRNQQTIFDDVTKLFEEVKKASKEVGKEPNPSDAGKLEFKASSLFKAQNNIKASPQLVLNFLDTYKHFCVNGNAFYGRKKEGEWGKSSVKGVVLYRNKRIIEILKDEGRTANNVPFAIEKIIEQIRKRGMVQGVFRECGKFAEIEQVINRMSVTDFEKLGAIELSSLLKRFIRDIPGGLIDNELQQSMIDIWCMKDLAKTERIKQIFLLLKGLSEENYTLLKQLMELNYYVQFHEKITLMNANNLAICWTPVLFDLMDLLPKMKEATEIVETMITGAKRYF